MTERKAADVVVSGRVQGVFFRARMQERAARLGVAGWVRNTAAGTVEAHLEGDPGAVDDLVAWCRTGPERAEVAGVEVTDREPDGTTGFDVRG